jgi:hypothetical protein
LTDTEAEHMPGCNMSFRRDVLEAVGGFDPRYRAAGDDVDICWRVQDQGWKIGYQAGALNWHHCRNSLTTYWRQQQGYGKAEALLEEKWPDKYNTAGHFTWQGRLYGKGITEAVPTGRWRIYQGQWGVAPFQSIYAPATGLSVLALMPEWYLLCWLLGFITLLGFVWQPLFWTVPLLAAAVTLPAIQAVRAAMKADFPTRWPNRRTYLKLRLISAWLHLLQPLARLIGRIRHGLTPWRMRTGTKGRFFSRSRVKVDIWSETWRSSFDWLTLLDRKMRKDGIRVVRGGDYDSWDIEIRGGLMGGARLIMAPEEHGGGKQLLKFQMSSRCSTWGQALTVVFLALGAGAVLGQAPVPAILLAGLAGLLAARTRYESITSLGAFRQCLGSFKAEVEDGHGD